MEQIKPARATIFPMPSARWENYLLDEDDPYSMQSFLEGDEDAEDLGFNGMEEGVFLGYEAE